jgi:hypothetical protein
VATTLAQRPVRQIRRIVVPDWVARFGPPSVVLLAYAGSALVVPTLANVAVTDDWVYFRSVETLLVEHRLSVHQMSSAALVFQTVWGAAFAALFGLSFGALRVSTLTMVGLGGLGFYGLCRELNVSRAWSALGMAACLFHPLFLSLAFTFMTDPHFAALSAIATWLYVRGLRGNQVQAGWIWAAAVVAACATLVRQQGVLLPISVAAAWLIGGSCRFTKQRLIGLFEMCVIPLGAAVAYSVWLRDVNGTPWALRLFWSDIAQAGWFGLLALAPRLAVIEAVYIGLFVLPLVVAAAPRVARFGSGLRGWPALAAVGWAAVVGPGALAFWFGGGLAMPYVGQFVTPTGLGPEDLIAARPLLMDVPTRLALTLVCALASIGAGVLVMRQLAHTPRIAVTGIGLVLAVGAGQAIGTAPPSVHFIGWGGTLDRYLLPLLPFAILLVLWAMRSLRPLFPVACLAVLLMAAWSVAGTRDHLVFLDTVWSVAAEAQELGVADVRLDAGAGWDGFHVYEAPPDRAPEPQTRNGPWWTELFAPATDSSYVVAGARLPGYGVVLERGYWSWLQQRWVPLYLLRKPGDPGPP